MIYCTITREELLRLSPTELLEIILRLQERIVSLEAEVASLQEYLAQSRKPDVLLYYRFYSNILKGKYLTVVVKSVVVL